MDIRALIPEHSYPVVLPDYWKNQFEDLRCVDPGSGRNGLYQTLNNTILLQDKLLSHVCLNGSFSHLSYDEWNARCYIKYDEGLNYAGWRTAAGVWSLFNCVIGLLGNLLTIVSVLYARSKQR